MKKGLQKLTKYSSNPHPILEKNKISLVEFESLSVKDRNVIINYIVTQLNELKDHEKDQLLEKVQDILPVTVKNQLWENNHYQITCAISKLVEDYGKMPTKNQIAKETGLSRTTIYKHLKEYTESPLYKEEIRKFKFMADRVLAKVFKIAVKDAGDVKAARLFFEVVGFNNKILNSSQIMNTQNNFIQINQTRLSQAEILNLKPEQLNLIESIIKGASIAHI